MFTNVNYEMHILLFALEEVSIVKMKSHFKHLIFETK